MRAWVQLANWKSMSDVAHMCQHSFGVHQTEGAQEEAEDNKNRKIKFVLHWQGLTVKSLFLRKIWHLGGDMTTNNKVYVFRNIIMS